MKFWSIWWAPAALLALGAILTVGIQSQRAMPLRAPLDSVVPSTIAGYAGHDITLSEGEQRVAGFTEYLMRTYERPTSSEIPWFSVYVAYYEQQAQGKTIHTPKNCLPGSGWQVLSSRTVQISTLSGRATVNRYVLQRESALSLVLYWYQGRGRVEANEYRVKVDLLADAALRRRSDEALVRIVAPVLDSEEKTFELVAVVAGKLVHSLRAALPQ